MRRAPYWSAVVGVCVLVGGGPAQAGVYVTLATGLPGVVEPTATSSFTFDTPAGMPPVVAINQLSGGFSAEAGTAGGTTFFGSLATPVVLSLADGSAYVSAGGPPAKPMGTATTAPTGGDIPSGAILLGVTVAEGSSTVVGSFTAADGTALGSVKAEVPADGWWVIGLSPTDVVITDPVPVPVDPIPDDPLPPNDPSTDPVERPTDEPPVQTAGTGPTTPEPTTLALVGIGGLAVAGWRRVASSRPMSSRVGG